MHVSLSITSLNQFRIYSSNNSEMYNRGMMGAPIIMNGVYMFTGPCTSFEVRGSEILTDHQAPNVKEVNISLSGNQITNQGICCLICTLVWGAFSHLSIMLHVL